MKLPEELLQISFALGVVDQVDRHLHGGEQKRFVGQLLVSFYYIYPGKLTRTPEDPLNKDKIMAR